MATNAPPSIDPASEDTLQGAFDSILKKNLQGIDDMLPARVISYDRPSNRAQVQPMIAMMTTAGAQVQRAGVAAVPVLQVGGGGMVLSFNLKPGDLGWIKANDRDISMFMQSMAGGPPNTRRMHSFEDGLFIPHAMKDLIVPAGQEEAVSLQTMDGEFRVSIGADYVELASPGGKLTLGAAGMAWVGGPFTINGIPFGSHKHTGVTVGAGSTGGPTP